MNVLCLVLEEVVLTSSFAVNLEGLLDFLGFRAEDRERLRGLCSAGREELVVRK